MEFTTDILSLFDKKWALVTAGDISDFNAMTISWGAMGTLWSKPTATVYIKPVRYTHDFMEANDYFTISFFEEKYRGALKILGTKSGRDGDKMAETKLTPVRIGENIVGYVQAYRTLVCRKIYRQDLELSPMPEAVRETYYEKEAPHTMYIGEIVGIG
ncbi:MAG: flavin reductase [Clostridiales bacterium]|nr:flavin reductase [Clostridiales bacterium]